MGSFCLTKVFDFTFGFGPQKFMPKTQFETYAYQFVENLFSVVEFLEQTPSLNIKANLVLFYSIQIAYVFCTSNYSDNETLRDKMCLQN